MTEDFEILHHSYRIKWASGQKLSQIIKDDVEDWQYYIYNLVFRASGDLKKMCMEDTKKWKKGEVCIDTQKYNEYIDGIKLNFNDKETKLVDNEKCHPITITNNSGIDRKSLFVKGYIQNISPFLIYREKFDVFQFREYLQYHPATTGIIQMIEDLKNKKSYGIQSSYSHFYSALKSLEYWWD